jgi:hypothetical protein
VADEKDEGRLGNMRPCHPTVEGRILMAARKGKGMDG